VDSGIKNLAQYLCSEKKN